MLILLHAKYYIMLTDCGIIAHGICKTIDNQRNGLETQAKALMLLT